MINQNNHYSCAGLLMTSRYIVLPRIINDKNHYFASPSTIVFGKNYSMKNRQKIFNIAAIL